MAQIDNSNSPKEKKKRKSRRVTADGSLRQQFYWADSDTEKWFDEQAASNYRDVTGEICAALKFYMEYKKEAITNFREVSGEMYAFIKFFHESKKAMQYENGATHQSN